MLILTLKENEKFEIDKELSVMVIKIKGKKVHLGIETPAGSGLSREKPADPEGSEPMEQKNKVSSKNMIQILEEEDPALANLIKKKNG